MWFPRNKRETKFFASMVEPGEMYSGEDAVRGFYRNFSSERDVQFWDVERPGKRFVVKAQAATLKEHSRKHGLVLKEIAPAGNPQQHLLSCVSRRLVSYELSKYIHRRQRKDAPYPSRCCRTQRYLRGNIANAILSGAHSECNFFNNDIMGTLVSSKLPGYEVLLLAFLRDGKQPCYYRAVHVTGGKSTNKRGFPTNSVTKQRADRLLGALGFAPVERWYSYQDYKLPVVTRTYFYYPQKKVQQWISHTSLLLGAVRRQCW